MKTKTTRKFHFGVNRWTRRSNHVELSDNPEVRFSGKGSGFGSIPKYNPTCSLNARDSKAVF